jgi:hypothetical protein
VAKGYSAQIAGRYMTFLIEISKFIKSLNL